MTKREIDSIFQKAVQSITGAEVLLEKNLPGFSASRAYYAMFYIAEALLASRGLSFSKHSAVIAAFGQHFTKSGLVNSKFHEYLIQASADRNVGDYAFGNEIGAEEAELHIKRAREFLEAARQFSNTQGTRD